MSDLESFTDLVKDALAHLYDFARLRPHPLLDLLVPNTGQGVMERVLSLRQQLLEAIEALKPDPKVPKNGKEWRPYRALTYYFVDGLPLQEVERRLGLGDRQVLRERTRGMQAVAAMLWERRLTSMAPSGEEPEDARARSPAQTIISREVAQIGVEWRPTSVRDLLESASQSVDSLARELGVALELESPPLAVTAMVDPTLLRQALIAMLSQAIKACRASSVHIVAMLEEDLLRIAARWPRPPGDGASQPTTVVETLAEAQGGRCRVEQGETETTMLLEIPQRRSPSILLIDDNMATLQLYKRYLGQHSYRITCAGSGQEGLALAEAERPEIIVLDVMMRGMDGWEVLQKLKTLPSSRDIPVVVCSVLPESTLAFSLGAQEFLTKPVSRRELLGAIERCQGHPRTVG